MNCKIEQTEVKDRQNIEDNTDTKIEIINIRKKRRKNTIKKNVKN